MDSKKLQYPIGPFKRPAEISENDIREAISILEVFPDQLRVLVANLPETTLKQPYRPEGWTIGQLVHHIADSHHHSYIRFKWALTEDNPLIKAYDQDEWAAIGDYDTLPISWSLSHIDTVHHKLTYVLRMLTADQWERTFQHPDKKKPTSLKENAMFYAWHSMHHFAHIKNALDNM